MKETTVVSLLLLSACAAPQWIELGTGRFGAGPEAVLAGVGSVDSIVNEDLAWSTADNRARSELANVVTELVAEAVRRTAAELAAGDDGVEPVDDSAAVGIRFTRAVLERAEITEHWVDEPSYYARAELSLVALREHVLSLELPAEARERFSAHLDAVLAE